MTPETTKTNWYRKPIKYVKEKAEISNKPDYG